MHDLFFLYFQVNYINAHATSTLAGDLAEVRAIKQVFKNTSEIKINSTKVRLLPYDVSFLVAPLSDIISFFASL
jgi:hypothetical protein